MKKILLSSITLLAILFMISCTNQKEDKITPNQFKGTDTQRIQTAVDKAAGTTGTVFIPAVNSNGSGIWLIDSAILLPDNITVILENCTVQLSDSCRDNMFRNKNVGIGITDPEWNYNISIIGVGNVLLKGASNPRATGDGGKKLSLDPDADVKKTGDWRHTYGTDAGREGVKQTGDWRNIMILMAYVDGFKLKNVTIEKSHAWAVSHERVVNADISDITFINSGTSIINGKTYHVRNRDGINLRHGCKNFRINNISGETGDDFIALSTLGIHTENSVNGGLNSTMVTSRNWRGTEDDTEQVFITNIKCKTPTRAVAIRSNDTASINNVYINGVFYDGPNNTFLVGGKGYGAPTLPGRINNIHAMNFIGNGRSLVLIEEELGKCTFINGIYKGKNDKMIIYNIDKDISENIITSNLIKINDNIK